MFLLHYFSGYLTIKDFELALSKILSNESKDAFDRLDNEYADHTEFQLGEGRVQPSVEQPEVQWSLSRWSNLRLSDILNPEEGQVNNDPVLNQPAEIADLQTLFPEFYASLPDTHLNG